MYRPDRDPSLDGLRTLGQGGTALVYETRHSGLRRRVAIKCPLPDAAPGESALDFAGLARREFQLIGGYRFPGLVRIVADPSPEFDHLILQLCEGPSLDQVLPIADMTSALNVISALALNLEFLRAVDLVHGDLKPQNFFLPSDWKAVARRELFYTRLSDFSLGRFRTEAESARLGVGTVGYMAPETVTNSRTSHQSDLFALGVIAYQVLAGTHPFMDGDSEPVRVTSRVCEDSPTSLSDARADILPQVGELVNGLLSKSEDDRPASGWEVCLALEEAGATYPFRRALHPEHLMQAGRSYDETVRAMVRLDDDKRGALDELTDGCTDPLRLILSSNFRRGMLEYRDGRFELAGRWYRPARCRRHWLSQYSEAGWAEKRRAVKAAVTGGFDRLALVEPGTKGTLPKSLPGVLLPLLRVPTVKRIAKRLATVAEKDEANGLAAELFILSGEIEKAERCADIAAREMRNNGQTRSALHLLRKIVWAASDAGKEFECRPAFVLKGVVHLENGEIEAAKATHRKVIDVYSDRPEDLTLAEAYNGLGDAFRIQQDCKSSLEALNKALGVARRIGNELQMSHTLVNMGIVHWLEGDLRQALSKFRAAYEIQKRFKTVADRASTLHNMATIFLMDGRLRRGVFLLRHALELKREVGHLGEIARSLNNLGYAHQMLGEPAKAVEFLAESLEINRRIGSRKEVLYNIENLVRLQISAGHLREALSLAREGTGMATERDYRVHLASLQVFAASVAKRMGRPGEAARSLATAGDTIQQLDDNQVILFHAVQSASLRLYVGDRQGALELAGKAYDEAKADHNTASQLEALLLLNRLAESSDHFDAAIKAIDELHLIRERRVLPFSKLEMLLESGGEIPHDFPVESLLGETLTIEDDLEAAWMNNLAAELLLKRGDQAAARTHLDRAAGLARKMGLAPELIVAQALLGQIAEAERDYETCYGLYKNALGLCKKISDDIESPADKTTYQRSRWVTFLAGAIKKLALRLGQKEKAGR